MISSLAPSGPSINDIEEDVMMDNGLSVIESIEEIEISLFSLILSYSLFSSANCFPS